VTAEAMNSHFDLTGQVAVVTGGNTGLGLGIARGLAKAGAAVAIWARDPVRNEAALAELSPLTKAVAVQCDVSRPEQAVSAAAETAAQLGTITTCFAAAGINRVTPFLDTTVDEFREVLGTNLEGTFNTFQAVVPSLIRAGGGSLAAVSSISARSGQPGSCHYAATKAGVAAVVKSLAVELARHKIRANVIVPGWMETAMIAKFLESEKFVERVLKRIPQRRWGQPADLEGLAVFLAGSGSSYLTGAELVVDGGYNLF
jgi:NAD(P)-dependent dehydrogenase (short-subunit alcohol dehydrogenase family)